MSSYEELVKPEEDLLFPNLVKPVQVVKLSLLDLTNFILRTINFGVQTRRANPLPQYVYHDQREQKMSVLLAESKHADRFRCSVLMCTPLGDMRFKCIELLMFHQQRKLQLEARSIVYLMNDAELANAAEWLFAYIRGFIQ